MMRVAFGLAAAFAVPGAASAHAFGQQYTLPLPVNFYIAGGVAALAASFAVLMAIGRPRDESRQFGFALSFRLPRTVRFALGAAGLAVLAGGIAFGLFGAQDFELNPVPDAFWLALLIGFLYLSALIGGLWPVIDPFRLLARPFARTAAALPPPWLEFVPASILLALLWLELFSEGLGALPSAIAIALLAYAVLSLAMARIYGDAWVTGGDFFSRLFGLASLMAPVRLDEGRLAVSPPGEGLVHARGSSGGTLALILILLGATVFDGLRETRVWWDLVWSLGISSSAGFYLLEVLSFLLIPVVLFALYALAMSGMAALTDGHRSPKRLRLEFAHSLVPIAIAYHVAHYFTLPFSRAGVLIGADTVWNVQLSAIVAGHILAAVVAHRIALRLFPRRRDIVRGQLPMILLMVCFTAFGLWALAQPYA